MTSGPRGAGGGHRGRLARGNKVPRGAARCRACDTVSQRRHMIKVTCLPRTGRQNNSKIQMNQTITNKQSAYAQLNANSARLQASVLKLSKHLDNVRAVQHGAGALASSLTNALKSAAKSGDMS